MNTVAFTGRLASDPEIKYTNDNCLARFSLAVQRDFKNKDGDYVTDFFDVIAFRRQAEFVEKYVKKGTKIEFNGKAQRDTWTDKDGKKMSRIVFVADRITFAESKSSSGSGADKPAPQKATGTEGFVDVPEGLEETLPFT